MGIFKSGLSRLKGKKSDAEILGKTFEAFATIVENNAKKTYKKPEALAKALKKSKVIEKYYLKNTKTSKKFSIAGVVITAFINKLNSIGLEEKKMSEDDYEGLCNVFLVDRNKISGKNIANNFKKVDSGNVAGIENLTIKSAISDYFDKISENYKNVNDEDEKTLSKIEADASNMSAKLKKNHAMWVSSVLTYKEACNGIAKLLEAIYHRWVLSAPEMQPEQKKKEVEQPKKKNAGVISKFMSTLTTTKPTVIKSLNDFKKAKGAKNIKISEEIDKIPEKAFCECKNLVEISIPKNVTEIGDYAFAGCENLVKIAIPESVTEIGSDAFENCKSLVEITIPANVTAISWGVFSGCESLVKITIPESVKIIGPFVFSNCRSLTKITIPESVTEIGLGAFSGCESLVEITIPESVTKIGMSAFENCKSLVEITIPESVTKIGMSAFENCKSLVEITIPESVTKIGMSAFSRCNKLTTINFKDEKYNSVEDFLKEFNQA